MTRNSEVDFEDKYHFTRECMLEPLSPQPQRPPSLMGTVRRRKMPRTAKYADLWNKYYDDTHNEVDEIERLRPIVDDSCRKEGRDPATFERTVADSSADPWWDRLPTENWVGNGTIKPLTGEPKEVASKSLEQHAEGISHVQVTIELTTPQTIEAFVLALEALDSTASSKT